MTSILELQRDTLARHLRKHLAGEVRFDAASRRLYSTDASIYQIEPLGVVIPRTADDIVATVQVCAEMRIAHRRPRRRHQSVGAVDRSRRHRRLQQVSQRDPRPRSRRRASRACSLASCSISSIAHGRSHDLQFGPDVATASRANLGGMIGNNSAGSRSIVYGKTIDHVRRLDVVLSTASRRLRRRCRPPSGSARGRQVAGSGTLSHGARQWCGPGKRRDRAPLSPHPAACQRLQSRCFLSAIDRPRRRRGACINSSSAAKERWRVIAEAELKLVPRPRVRGLLVPQFATLAAALDALAAVSGNASRLPSKCSIICCSNWRPTIWRCATR